MCIAASLDLLRFYDIKLDFPVPEPSGSLWSLTGDHVKISLPKRHYVTSSCYDNKP